MKLGINDIFVTVALMGSAMCLRAQDPISANEDSLKAVLMTDIPDSTRIDDLILLSRSYFFKQPDTGFLYAKAALDTARKIGFEMGIIRGLLQAGASGRSLGYHVDALSMQMEALERSRKLDSVHYEALANGYIGLSHYDLADYELSFYDDAISYLRRSLEQPGKLRRHTTEPLFNIYLARAYIETDQFDSAFFFLREAGNLLNKIVRPIPQQVAIRAFALGDYYNRINEHDSAYHYFKRAMKVSTENLGTLGNSGSLSALELSTMFEQKGQMDSAIYFARYSYHLAKLKKLNARMFDASKLLLNLHGRIGNQDSADYYKDISNTIGESLYSNKKLLELQVLLLNGQKRVQETLRSEERYQNGLILIGLVTITAVILIATILLFRSNRIKLKTNLVLQQTLNELKATQSQLIQSEKMASLGELTAGIAHEIQNPLNFVNNFSELNAELVEDLKKENTSGNKKSVEEIADSIRQNQEKINQHGKRADAIVKSMLQHSRTSGGQKELTDINSLCDEYLRLAYHGFRAKDKSFNAKFETDFDSNLPKVNVIAQDIGRVILNLINNAFYAVNQRAKAETTEYIPLVIVSTKNLDSKIEARVRDNGSGIAETIREKIFHPFFTTKPTGQGTGLGLSLAYDIVTKQHAGELKLETKTVEGSEFIIIIPYTK